MCRHAPCALLPLCTLQAVRDSIPLFGVQQSISVNDSIALDRLSLDDIAPFSRKKVKPGHKTGRGDHCCRCSPKASLRGCNVVMSRPLHVHSLLGFCLK